MDQQIDSHNPQSLNPIIYGKVKNFTATFVYFLQQEGFNFSDMIVSTHY